MPYLSVPIFTFVQVVFHAISFYNGTIAILKFPFLIILALLTNVVK